MKMTSLFQAIVLKDCSYKFLNEVKSLYFIIIMTQKGHMWPKFLDKALNLTKQSLSHG